MNKKELIQSPPYCPRPECTNHTKPPRGKWYFHNGVHHTQAHGHVPRFKCKDCGKTFSSQTFGMDYYLKRSLDWIFFTQHMKSSMSDRALARFLGVATGAVKNRVNRLRKSAVKRCV